MIKIEKYTNPEYYGNMYLLTSQNKCLVVDPCVNFSQIKSEINEKKLVGVFLTHAHFDHFCEIESFFNLDTKFYLTQEANLKIKNCDENASNLFGKKVSIDIPDEKICYICENEKLNLGDEQGRFIILKGHTDCSAGLIIAQDFFCGDFIFENGHYGRYDLPTGNGEEMRNSFRKLKTLDKDLIVHSGHGNDFLLKNYK